MLPQLARQVSWRKVYHLRLVQARSGPNYWVNSKFSKRKMWKLYRFGVYLSKMSLNSTHSVITNSVLSWKFFMAGFNVGTSMARTVSSSWLTLRNECKIFNLWIKNCEIANLSQIIFQSYQSTILLGQAVVQPRSE